MGTMVQTQMNVTLFDDRIVDGEVYRLHLDDNPFCDNGCTVRPFEIVFIEQLTIDFFCLDCMKEKGLILNKNEIYLLDVLCTQLQHTHYSNIVTYLDKKLKTLHNDDIYKKNKSKK